MRSGLLDLSPRNLMAGRRVPVRLVIFDCDGVIIDSEPIADAEVSAAVSALGWPLSPAEANAQFLGKSLSAMIPMIEARIGSPLPPDWEARFLEGFLAGLAREVTAITGALDAIDAIEAMGLPWRVASNSTHAEMAVKFRAVGFTDRVAGRLHSFTDVANPKPAPDLYLAAASAAGIPPAACLVIEDSPIGARAACAAGMECLGFAPNDAGPHGGGTLRAVGAVPFAAMAELPALVRLGARL